MNRILTLFLILFLINPALSAQQDIRLSSPDNDLIVLVSHSDAGLISYTLDYKSHKVIEPSALGFKLNRPEVSLFEFTLLDISESSHDSKWKPVWGEVATIRNHYNQLILELESKTEPAIRVDVVFRLFNDGLGFRYHFPEQPDMDHFIIAEEHTQFQMAEDHTTFWIPGDYDTNEYLYNTTLISEIDSEDAADREKDIAVQSVIPGNAVQTPLMMKSDDGLYINIHEAALLNYATMHLDINTEDLLFETNLTPDAVGNKGYLETPASTPWRTILVSDDARDLLSSKTILNLNEPTELENTDWITPQKFIGVWWEMHIGKGSWELEGSDIHAANTENVKKYIDFAAEHGFDGVLVEGWNVGWADWFGNWKEDVFDFVTPYPDYDIDYLSDYASSKGVRIIMHHETSGSVTNYERRMDDAFEFMNEHNMNTVKTGYVGKIIPRGEHHDGQWMNRHFGRVAEKAAEYKIMLVPHESSRPTGLHRTYPNWLANEAARGNEFNNAPTFGMTPEHQTILPFTRLMGGPMDFTPGLFDFKLNDYITDRTTEVRTTIAKQLGLYITMYSPIQMAGDLPEVYEQFPDELAFIERVPVDWDDTRILEAEPGDKVIIARKEKGTQHWFVGGVSDEESRLVNLDLSFLEPGLTYTATIYKDGENAHWDTNPESISIETMSVTSESQIPITMAPGGGFAVSLIRD